MYGDRVHQAVLESGDSITGVTVHIIDEEYDTGPIIAQTEVPVFKDDDVSSLKTRVLKKEHEFFVEVLKSISHISW